MKNNRVMNGEYIVPTKDINQFVNDWHIHAATETELHTIISNIAAQITQTKPLLEQAIAIAKKISTYQTGVQTPPDGIRRSLETLASKINLLAINTAIIAEKNAGKTDGLKVIAKEMQALGEQAVAIAQEAPGANQIILPQQQTKTIPTNLALQELVLDQLKLLESINNYLGQSERYINQLITQANVLLQQKALIDQLVNSIFSTTKH